MRNLFRDRALRFHISTPPQNKLPVIAVPFHQWDELSSLEFLRLGLRLVKKSYLPTKFILGEHLGQKADPTSVTRAMMRANDTSGNPLFTSEESLTQSQIAGFFSRLASKKRLESEDDKDPLDIEDIEGASNEAQLEELTSMASQAVCLIHPIS